MPGTLLDHIFTSYCRLSLLTSKPNSVPLHPFFFRRLFPSRTSTDLYCVLIDSDIAIWSQTSWRWLESKLIELSLIGDISKDYSIVFVLDRTLMPTVYSEKRGVAHKHQCKPLEVIWNNHPQYTARNTIAIDDLSKNFVFNIGQGLKIKAYKVSFTLAFSAVHPMMTDRDFASGIELTNDSCNGQGASLPQEVSTLPSVFISSSTSPLLSAVADTRRLSTYSYLLQIKSLDFTKLDHRQFKQFVGHPPAS